MTGTVRSDADEILRERQQLARRRYPPNVPGLPPDPEAGIPYPGQPFVPSYPQAPIPGPFPIPGTPQAPRSGFPQPTNPYQPTPP